MTNTLVAFFTCIALVLAPSLARADDLADAKTFISKQMEQIKKADVDGVKAGMSRRQAGKITKEMLTKAQGEAAKYTLEDLVDKVDASKDALKIKMKNGRTLTTLIKEDGAWKADTIWFK